MTNRHENPSLSVRPALATFLGLAAALVLVGCSSGAAGTSSSTSAPVPSMSSTPGAGSGPPTSSSGSPDEARLLAYAGGESAGVEIHGPQDVSKLDGAPASFTTFIGRAAQQVVDGASCSDPHVGITVEFLRTDGYASGGVNECGGYRALWADVDGAWQQVEGTQDAWSCAVLARYEFPSDVAGTTCYDYHAQEERPYEHA